MINVFKCVKCDQKYNALDDDKQPNPPVCHKCRMVAYKEKRQKWHDDYLEQHPTTKERLEIIEKWMYDFEHNAHITDIRILFKTM